MADDNNLKTSHMAIVLGIGLGVVLLIVLSLVGLESFFQVSLSSEVIRVTLRIRATRPRSTELTIVINRRDRRSFLRSRKNPDERLASLDAVSPTRTLEQWWTMTKGKMGLSEAVDGQFVCAVCLEQVDRSEEIRELRCLHVFHRECLEKWFLGDHYNCPLCHRAYFVAETPPRHDYVWMV
ncbi:uncharacterized protein N7484_006335 [Penicillium longicatenatum]|uniref:uncharacterized protein n=1 Tax=Penicillium longicatenatum TaxID=1561947 RepID=UPI00254939B0|nr:uncharacterized protein N7484_006335 [Penicillium longicatenatum]KAJ5643828.1 hypothetical protein N7484_006335 [Penicillium longicatenatum]